MGAVRIRFMEELTTDILVIGSGLTGMVAALEAEKLGLKVLLLGKFAIGMGTNSSLANGAFTAATSRFSQEDHLRMTLETGKGLNRVPLVRTLVANGPDAVERLIRWGVPLVERRIGFATGRPEGSSQLPGVLIVKPLREKLGASTIQPMPGFTVFDLVVEEERIQGVFGFFKDGRPCLVGAKAIILATGGGGAIYLRNDNQGSTLGDGYTLALRAGLPVLDLEFVQFYPFVLAEPRLSTLLLFPPPKGVRIFNEKDEDLFEKLGIENLNEAMLSKRDSVSVTLYESSLAGDVYMDMTQVPEKYWEEYPLNFLRKSKFPFRNRPFLISPAVHFFMGGVEADGNGKTCLPGLFAAGEVAWGIHGANRLGGNALTECVVFGALAGQSAAQYVKESDRVRLSFSDGFRAKWERRATTYLRKKRGAFDRPFDLMKELKSLAWRCAGPVREEEGLKRGLDRLTSIEERIEKIYPSTLKDLFKKRNLENAALLLRAILQGSLLRTESRGSFFRKDFPSQDDLEGLKHTCFLLRKEGLQTTHRPVETNT